MNKGIRAYGRLARPLVDYLLAIRPRNARGYIHPNPETGKPYTDIRKQWDRLIAIASEMLAAMATRRPKKKTPTLAIERRPPGL